ncbi:MAG TPA: hypothetical protein VGC41_02890 [Kofleriaceae bacterium]
MHTNPDTPKRRGSYKRLQTREAEVPQGDQIERLTVNFSRADGDRLRNRCVGPPRRNMSDMYRVALREYLDKLDRQDARKAAK